MSNDHPEILKQSSSLPTESPLASKKPLDAKALRLKKKEEKKLQKAKEKLQKSQQSFRDYLNREKSFGKLSQNRGWEDWENWWRQVGLDGLKEDLAVLAQSVNRFMDRSEHAVETVGEHRLQANEQHLRLYTKHSETIDHIFGERTLSTNLNLQFAFSHVNFLSRHLQALPRSHT
jgi:hypothetical protein